MQSHMSGKINEMEIEFKFCPQSLRINRRMIHAHFDKDNSKWPAKSPSCIPADRRHFYKQAYSSSSKWKPLKGCLVYRHCMWEKYVNMKSNVG